MTVKITRIGNSRGIRIPKEILDLYKLHDGDELELEQTRDGIRLIPVPVGPRKLSFEASYGEMASEAAEDEEWTDWDGVAGDGIDG